MGEVKIKERGEKAKEEAERSKGRNIKGNRLCVVQEMYPHFAMWKVPEGLDLTDKIVVREWEICGDCLEITYVDGRKEEIEWYSDPYEYIQLDAKETMLEYADDWNVEYDEDFD